MASILVLITNRARTLLVRISVFVTKGTSAMIKSVVTLMNVKLAQLHARKTVNASMKWVVINVCANKDTEKRKTTRMNSYVGQSSKSFKLEAVIQYNRCTVHQWS